MAHADLCSEHLQNVINIESFDDIASQLKTIPNLKDEYETTAAFNNRVTVATNKINKKFFVYTSFDPSQLTYDADNKTLSIKSYAIDNKRTKYSRIFGYGSNFLDQVEYSSDNIDVVVSSKDKRKGTYTGQNSFGVKTKISAIERTTKAIFDKKAAYGADILVTPYPNGRSVDRSYVIGVFANVSPEIAKKFKETALSAVLIEPKHPYYVKGGTSKWGEPTLSNPVKIVETLEVIVADIQCAFITNAEHKVFLSIKTN
ncbi:hypothetical protein [Shewanella nanhaiensis]|uniref:Uncharacterized protein n=1 Tax=Shewanella nanhaiensis TaxID=2864872 RepID=A0ABS7E8N6_9GAMM|nr:hypothetical protein [Shewanella nanhaiensis]MBW8186056.1 hypothetical protein [Shewanella nanhaiensis]